MSSAQGKQGRTGKDGFCAMSIMQEENKKKDGDVCVASLTKSMAWESSE